ncbi:MAG: rhodanese-like domain-containing protein [Candidatus Micrarchaeota archaeon]
MKAPIAAMLLLLTVLGCTAKEPGPGNATYTNITESTLQGMMEEKDFFLLDVHVPEVQEHLNGTDAFIPYDAIGQNLDKLPQQRDAKIVVYCRTGRMSADASQKLADLGYTNVYNVMDGIGSYRDTEGAGIQTGPQPQNASQNASPAAPADDANASANALAEKIIPSGGIVLPVRWNDVGPRTLASGAINLSKFEERMAFNGRPLTPEQMGILVNGSDSAIMMDRNNSYFVLNVFWAFGLANRNPVLGGVSGKIGDASVNNMASTAGWPLGEKRGRELYNGADLLVLDARQQEFVESVANSTYRPCCNNPTSFPDCNHGMAALGLLEWMAYQNASEDEMYDALLTANSYWFPQSYIETAAYLGYQNVSWESVGARELLSANYSSYTGYQNTRKKLEGFPPVLIPGGGCGV